jgi:mRNA-degrading endonuclease RelE of RelBE toxin-antitoxin system
MKIIRLACFKRDYKKLPSRIQAKLDEQLTMLIQDAGHPSLRVKKMEGHPNCWEGRITREYRFTFMWDKDSLVLRRAGTHDILGRG